MSASAHGLCEFIDASPSPFHVCVTVAQRLSAAGFTELSERDEWPGQGSFFTVRAGSLVAWRSEPADGPFRIVGAHTDSPNLRVKQHPDRFVSGWQVVALAPYGGAWLNSWLDRDLGISGRLSVRVGDSIDHRLVRIDEPIDAPYVMARNGQGRAERLADADVRGGSLRNRVVGAARMGQPAHDVAHV